MVEAGPSVPAFQRSIENGRGTEPRLWAFMTAFATGNWRRLRIDWKGEGTMKRSVLLVFLCCLVAVIGSAQGTVTIKDFSGSTVAVPKDVRKVVSIHPIFTYMTWRVAPEKLVSVDKVFLSQYLSENGLHVFSNDDSSALKALPVTGVFFSGVDPEQILRLNPDVLVTITNDANIEKLKKQLGIPVLVLSKSRIQDYEQSFRVLGRAIGAQSEADKLGDYWKATISSFEQRAASMTQRRPIVYHIALGGITSTVGEKTIMASIVELAGGRNVSSDLPGNPMQETISVSMEQIIGWNPDIIVTQNDEQRKQILTDPAWRPIAAVQAKKVYTQLKYAYSDGLISLLGLKWYDQIINHPNDKAAMDAFQMGMREFYRLFYKYEIKPDQLTELHE